MEENFTPEVIVQSTNVLRAVGLAAIVAAVFFVLGMVLVKGIIPALNKKLDKDKHEAIAILLKGFRRPVVFWLRVAGALCVLLTLAVQLPADAMPDWVGSALTWVQPVIDKALRITAVVAVTWGLVASSDITCLVMKNARNKLDLHLTKSVTQFLSAIFKVIVIAIAAVVLLSEFNYNINGLIAGIGLSGVTVALAAQNTASNFFGGLVIVLEKPFEIGDYIVTPDIEGSVEEINLRSTRIRTVDGALTTVPNSTLSDSEITNWNGGITRRRANYTVGLTYATSRKSVAEISAGIRSLLNNTKGVEKDTCLVRFTDFAESSLNLTVIYYTDPGYADHLEIKERVNLKIMQLVEGFADADFAFPSRSVYLDTSATGKLLPEGHGGKQEKPEPQ